MTGTDARVAGAVRGARTSTRERRVLVGGALIVLMALLVTYGLLPFVRRWNARETRLEAARSEIAALTALVRNRATFDSLAAAHESEVLAVGQRVLQARTPTLAASALQSLLQDAADASRLVVTRLDVAPTSDASGVSGVADSLAPMARDSSVTLMPATLVAYGDIHGLAELLRLLRQGSRIVTIDRMTVNINSALRGAPDVVQLTLTLRAPVILE